MQQPYPDLMYSYEACEDPERWADECRIAREERCARRARLRKAARRRRIALGLLAVVTAVALGAVAYAYMGPSASTDETSSTDGESSSGASDANATSRQATGPGETPVFASCLGVELRLPVEPEALTEIGFHQASFRYALCMETPLPDADMTAARANRGTGRSTDRPRGADAVLNGSVLRMWREGGWGRPDTSADVGAPVGSTVISPVDGIVVRVRPYLLYGKWDDFEIHIRPEGRPELDVVLIHIDDVAVAEGDVVRAGITPLATIRRLDDKEPMQLRSYTPLGDGGNHVHLQVNDVTYPGYAGLDGAIQVEP